MKEIRLFTFSFLSRVLKWCFDMYFDKYGFGIELKK